MKKQIIKNLIKHAQGQIAKHKTNVEVYLQSSVGIGEHSDVMASIMAQYQEQIDVIKKYFKKGA